MGVFAVTKVSEGPVRPSAATPSDTLPLAWVDRYPTHRGLVESVHIYRDAFQPPPAPEAAAAAAAEEEEDQEKKKNNNNSKKPPAAVVRSALADALVHYYPFAGRIVEDAAKPGRPAVLCCAEGVYFVEATANCTLADVNFLERPLLLGKEDLVPYPAPELWAVEPHNTLAMIQVCVALNFAFSHRCFVLVHFVLVFSAGRAGWPDAPSGSGWGPTLLIKIYQPFVLTDRMIDLYGRKVKCQCT